MHIPMKFVSAMFVIAILFCSVFLNEKKEESLFELDLYRAPRVLGVSEASAQKPNRTFASSGFLQSKNSSLEPVRLADSSDIEIRDVKAFVLDLSSGATVYEHDSNRVVPIASITKLATALVFLEQNPDLNSIYEVRGSDRVNGGRVYIYPGERISLRNLLYLSLVGSANSATRALVSSTGLSEEEFVKKMNKKMNDLGLVNTHFVDPVGLNYYNSSSAREVASLASAALGIDLIADATQRGSYHFKTEQGRSKIVYNTDELVSSMKGSDLKILGGKTGYTEGAGYCFVGKFTNNDGRALISVVLGGDSRDSRFYKTRQLVEWTYSSHEWK